MKRQPIALLVIISTMIVLQGCVHITDVSNRSPYREQMGRRFTLLKDCFVFRTRKTGTNLFVGNYLVGDFLPHESSPEFINQKFGRDVFIVGILPKGSVFTIVRCLARQSSEDLIQSYYAAFDDPSFQGALLEISSLTDLTRIPPAFRDGFAEPLR